MIDRRVQEFVGNIIAKGQITFGDVRRLQRGYLPTGISSREELAALISLNAKIDRADKAWAEWLVAAVVDFVAAARGCEAATEEPAAKWVNSLLAASPTSLGRRIAREIRRELARRHTIESIGARQHHPERERGPHVGHSSPAAVPENDFAPVWSEMILGPSHRAVVQPSARSISLAA